MTTDAKKYPGTYRGVVKNNIDVMNANRILVQVQDVLGNDSCIWADPSYAVPGMNMVPAVDAGVWIQFEDGDIDRPFWTGFWRGGPVDTPPVGQTVPPGIPQVVMGTPGQNYVLITDAPGPIGGIQIQIRGPGGPSIKLTESFIELSCGPGLASIRLAGTGVFINNTSLVVPR
jgi:Type VI secretion system/phage-baseplate injector OB domain